MTEPAEALRALLDRPPSTPPPVEDLRQRVDTRRRRRTRRRIALAGLATILGAVAVVPLLDSPSGRSTQVIAGPASSPTTVPARPPSLEFQAPEGWTTLAAFGPTMVLGTRPLSESDRALALLARDDVAFRTFPPDGVVLVVGYDPVQAKYGFDSQNRPLDPGPAYALGPERVLPGGVRVRRGEIPQSTLRIASYAGPSAPAARLEEAEAIAATVRVLPAANASARSNPPPPGSRPGLPGGPLPVPEEEMSEVARATTPGRSTLALVAARDCAYVRPADFDPKTTPVSQVLVGACSSRPVSAAVEALGAVVRLFGPPGSGEGTAAIFRAGPQVRSVTARLVDGRSVAAALSADGWGLAAADGRIVALTGVDQAGRPVPEVLVQ